MTSQAFTTQGTTISVAGTAIGEITDFDGPNSTRSEIDVTTLSSVAREFRLALADRGSFNFNLNLNFGDQGQRILWAAQSDNTEREFIVTFADDDTTPLTFNGLVQNFGITGQVDNVVKGALTVKVTGNATGFPAP